MSADTIQNLHSEERQYAEWACYISNITRSGAVKLKIPFGALDQLPKTGYTPPPWPKTHKSPKKGDLRETSQSPPEGDEVPAASTEARDTTIIPPATKRPTPEQGKTPPNTINRGKDFDH